jgi:hypothetical protein
MAKGMVPAQATRGSVADRAEMVETEAQAAAEAVRRVAAAVVAAEAAAM